MLSLSPALIKSWLPRRKKTAHKGDCGRILVIAGSRGMVGAGVLSAWAALRSGAGLVKLATVQSQQVVAAKRAPLEVTTHGFPEGKRANLKIQSIIKSFKPTVIAMGPGMGVSASVRSTVQKVVRLGIPVVLDADGLRGLQKKKYSNLIITPHPGEMAHILKSTTKKVQANRLKFVKTAAKTYGCICLLKGAGTLVSDGKKVYKNKTGNPGMATAGTGDVLTGLIAGLLGQMKDKNLFRATCLGAYLHGRAGDAAAKKKTQRSLIASDLIEALPAVFKKIHG